MAIRVLVVDDSNFFCRRVAEILNGDPDIKVVGVAYNGQEAIAKTLHLKPDVITMDVEMPIMDGITALKQIMSVQPTLALMLSSLTYEGAKLTLDALDAGAVDFMLKSYEGISDNAGQLAHQLRLKVKEIGRSRIGSRTSRPIPEAPSSKPIEQVPTELPAIAPGRFKLITIGSSTGGPVALQKLVTSLPRNFSLPITVTQHMPGTFTGAFAQRLNSLTSLTVVEAVTEMPLQAGHVYIAPGGKQMIIEGSATNPIIKIRESDARLQYAPCVDVTFASVAKLMGNQTLAIVLTGMGSDGREGARLLKQAGAGVWTQDESSCVVYGMPMSVKKAGHSDFEFSIERLSDYLLKVV